MKKHWKFLDWIILISEFALPVIAILCAIFIKQENYSTDAKIATIVAGVIGQIILIGIQIKQVSIDLHTNKERIESVEKSISLTNAMAAILSSGEEKRIGYTRRRLNELKETFEIAAHARETEVLSVTTYYRELKYLKEQLENDPKKTECEIWAMTGFSDNEWDNDDNDLEKYWCEDLLKLACNIYTKRICIIDRKLISLFYKDKEFYDLQYNDWITHEDNEEKIEEKRLKSFVDYLKTYYASSKKKYLVENFALKSDSQQFHSLVEAKGFFGIKLSNGDRFVIKGEAVSAYTGLQGQYVFDEEVIEKLYNDHQSASRTLDDLSIFIMNNSSNAFKDFCYKLGIYLF